VEAGENISRCVSGKELKAAEAFAANEIDCASRVLQAGVRGTRWQAASATS
jgi:hypothetical protein